MRRGQSTNFGNKSVGENEKIQNESNRFDNSSVMDLTNIPNNQSQASLLFSQSQCSDAHPPNKKLKVKISFSRRKS